MRKILFVIVIALIGGLNMNEAKAQEVDCWAGINGGISTLNTNKNLMNYLAMDKKPAINGIYGVDWGATFKNNLDLILSIGIESSLKQFNNKTIQIDVASMSLDAAYPFLIKDPISLYGRIGFGLYHNFIQFGDNTNGIVHNLNFAQRFNLFIPVGLTLKMLSSKQVSSVISLLYRYSINTGITKQFGSGSKIADFPFVKLNGLLLTIGLRFGI
ncbi:MAG: outer membrane beta-barrel protein [Bacteroidales bacterium]|jgi:hypothetical protein|nr:outer membrane beta-barrel protein [Bacteroidales bacterium]